MPVVHASGLCARAKEEFVGKDVDATRRTSCAIALVHAVGTAAGKRKPRKPRRIEWIVSSSKKLEVERVDRGQGRSISSSSISPGISG